MAAYRPGVCNIGRVEQRRRLRIGIVSAVAALAWTAWVLGTDQPYRLLWGTGALTFGALVGYLQYRLRFCAGFAVLGRYDLTGSDGEAGSVAERAARRDDLVRAVQIVVGAAIGAVLLTVAIYVLDLFVLDPPRA